jgi:hypothetical protein
LLCIGCDTDAGWCRIEGEDNQEYLLQDILLRRYSIMIDGHHTAPANVIERAVDLHALRVTGSSGYQKCVNYLWRGWLVQDENDPSTFVEYKKKGMFYLNFVLDLGNSKRWASQNSMLIKCIDIVSYWTHVDPDRMRAPMYQNATQIIFSMIYLGLYTAAINSINPTADFDTVEIILYIFTAGFLFDEISKIWKVGWDYIGFWNVFNVVLYALLTTSMVLRIIALGYPLAGDGQADGPREKFNELSYNFLGT